MTNFSARIPFDNPKEMEKFNQAMNELQDAFYDEATKLAKKLGIDVSQAVEIQYLRSRSRWSQKLEDRLIRAYKDGWTEIPVLAGEEREWLLQHNY